MNSTRRILTNAGVTSLQVVINGVVFLVLYRFLYDAIGIEEFGVWATVLAWTSVTHIANLGLAAGTTKYVAMHLARGDRHRAGAVVETALLTVGSVIGLVLLVLYPAFDWVLSLVIDEPENIAAARQILPFAVVSFWFVSLLAVVGSSMDGVHRMDLRSIVTIVVALLYLGLVFVLVPRMGLMGLAWAQAAQAGIAVCASWILLSRLLPELHLVPRVWRKDVFVEMFSYSIKLQAISLFQVVTEPMAKIITAWLGGVSAVGFFEMANKLVLQARAILVYANHAIVPAIADYVERAPERIAGLYLQMARAMLILVALSLPLLLAAAPLISRLWLGAFEPLFVAFLMALAVGWFINILTTPAYLGYIGLGELKWNIVGHAVTASLFILTGMLLGSIYGGMGVVLAYATGQLVGSILVMLMYHREHDVEASRIWANEHLPVMLASLAGASCVAAISYWAAPLPPALAAVLALSAYALIVAYPAWTHPVRREAARFLSSSRQPEPDLKP